MAAVLLGLLIAAAFGSGDFVGGRATTRASTAAVLVVGQMCSVIGALGVALVVSAQVAPHDIVYGVLAGAVNVVGLGLLYHGLAHNSASVVAPIAAVTGSSVPVAWGLAHGERPSAIVLTGIVVAIAAGALIAGGPGSVMRRSLAQGTMQATAAGFLLGSSLVLFAHTSERSGQWPVLAARVAALALVAAAALWLARNREVRFPTGTARTLAIAAGIFDIAATSLLIVALRRELISVVAPIASLAPAFTVLLAWLVTGERMYGLQRVGLALAFAGLVLIAAG